jgi:8-oxo-dGTP diphosphatase
MPYTYEHPRPAVTVDCVVFGLDQDDLKVMLIRRGEKPFRGRWALPGGFVRMHESLEDAARRELEEETGLKDVYLEQLYTFGDPKRDPRGRTVSVAYYALVQLEGRKVRATTDAADAAWFSINDVPDLAFDHDRILEMAVTRLRGKVRYVPIGFELLPERFTLTQLQQLYETVLDRKFDKRNFRKKVLALGILEDTGDIQQDVSHRAARLFRFDEDAYKRLIKQGFNFEL